MLKDGDAREYDILAQDEVVAAQLTLKKATLDFLRDNTVQTFEFTKIAPHRDLPEVAINALYPRKIDLLIDAVCHLAEVRKEQFARAFDPGSPRSLDERLDDLWADYLELFPVSMGVLTALKSDSDLASGVRARAAWAANGETDLNNILFPQVASNGLSPALMAAIAAVYRGMLISVDHSSENFDAMRQLFHQVIASQIERGPKQSVPTASATGEPATLIRFPVPSDSGS